MAARRSQGRQELFILYVCASRGSFLQVWTVMVPSVTMAERAHVLTLQVVARNGDQAVHVSQDQVGVQNYMHRCCYIHLLSCFSDMHAFQGH